MFCLIQEGNGMFNKAVPQRMFCLIQEGNGIFNKGRVINAGFKEARSVPYDALYQNCTNSFAPPKKGFAEL